MVDDIDEVVEIIKASEYEDAKIFEENYCRLLNEVPEGTEKKRFIILRTQARNRMVELSND